MEPYTSKILHLYPEDAVYILNGLQAILIEDCRQSSLGITGFPDWEITGYSNWRITGYAAWGLQDMLIDDYRKSW